MTICTYMHYSSTLWFEQNVLFIHIYIYPCLINNYQYARCNIMMYFGSGMPSFSESNFCSKLLFYLVANYKKKY